MSAQASAATWPLRCHGLGHQSMKATPGNGPGHGCDRMQIWPGGPPGAALACIPSTRAFREHLTHPELLSPPAKAGDHLPPECPWCMCQGCRRPRSSRTPTHWIANKVQRCPPLPENELCEPCPRSTQRCLSSNVPSSRCTRLPLCTTWFCP